MLKLSQKLSYCTCSQVLLSEEKPSGLKMRTKYPPYCPFLPRKQCYYSVSFIAGALKLTQSEGNHSPHTWEELWTLRLRASRAERRHPSENRGIYENLCLERDPPQPSLRACSPYHQWARRQDACTLLPKGDEGLFSRETKKSRHHFLTFGKFQLSEHSLSNFPRESPLLKTNFTNDSVESVHLFDVTMLSLNRK